MKFKESLNPSPTGAPSSLVNLLKPSYGHTPLNVIESPTHKIFIFFFGRTGFTTWRLVVAVSIALPKSSYNVIVRG